MTLNTKLGDGFPKRSIVTTLVAGAIASLFVLQYFGLGHGAGFALGVALGTLHLYTWMGLGKQLLGPRDPVWIALWVLLKLGVVYAGALVYLVHQRPHAPAFAIGFGLIFFVMIQKVLGQKMLEQRKLRSVT
ncbi:MAG: hypothetical protein RBU30_05975 [Polyangia bacterium]|nr:hypothetical protein [Polyangia bacterium]